MTNEQLAAVILPWAKETHPDKYQQTLGVAARAVTFRNYLIRLIEIRWEEDPEWRMSAPLRALEETSIDANFRMKDGGVIQVRGKRCGERVWGWAELAVLLEQEQDIRVVKEVKEKWDLILEK